MFSKYVLPTKNNKLLKGSDYICMVTKSAFKWKMLYSHWYSLNGRKNMQIRLAVLGVFQILFLMKLGFELFTEISSKKFASSSELIGSSSEGLALLDWPVNSE